MNPIDWPVRRRRRRDTLVALLRPLKRRNSGGVPAMGAGTTGAFSRMLNERLEAQKIQDPGGVPAMRAGATGVFIVSLAQELS